MRGEQILKILQAVRLLTRSKGASVQELQKELQISRRSVYRLIGTLEALGFPVEEPWYEGKAKRYRIMKEFSMNLPNLVLPPLNLTEVETLLLLYLLGKAHPLGDTKFASALSSLKEKLFGSGRFPPSSSSRESTSENIEKESWNLMNPFAPTIFLATSSHAKDYKGKEGFIQTLVHAMQRRKKCRIQYHSLSSRTTRLMTIDPLRMVEHRGGLYVLAFYSKYGSYLTLAVDRISKLDLMEEEFVEPADFDPEALLREPFSLTLKDPLHVRLWVSSSQAPYMKERRWGEHQTIEDQPDGSILLSFSTSGSWDVKTWVLSLGSEARLLEPPALVNEIREEICRMAKGYCS